MELSDLIAEQSGLVGRLQHRVNAEISNPDLLDRWLKALNDAIAGLQTLTITQQNGGANMPLSVELEQKILSRLTSVDVNAGAAAKLADVQKNLDDTQAQLAQTQANLTAEGSAHAADVQKYQQQLADAQAKLASAQAEIDADNKQNQELADAIGAGNGSATPTSAPTTPATGDSSTTPATPATSTATPVAS